MLKVSERKWFLMAHGMKGTKVQVPTSHLPPGESVMTSHPTVVGIDLATCVCQLDGVERETATATHPPALKEVAIKREAPPAVRALPATEKPQGETHRQVAPGMTRRDGHPVSPRAAMPGWGGGDQLKPGNEARVGGVYLGPQAKSPHRESG